MRKASPFVIPLREIPPEGASRTFDLGGEWAPRTLGGTEAALEPGDHLRADVALQRAHHDVYARGRVVGVLTVPCSRCLNPAPLLVDSPFELTFVPAGSEDDLDAEVEITEDLADLATYEDDEVDLEETLREELLLALPIAHVCREGCKGLCPRCGTNWNEGPCDCPPAPTDDRWASLRNVKV